MDTKITEEIEFYLTRNCLYATLDSLCLNISN